MNMKRLVKLGLFFVAGIGAFAAPGGCAPSPSASYSQTSQSSLLAAKRDKLVDLAHRTGVSARTKNRAQALYEQAVQAYAQGNFAEAEQLLDEGLALFEPETKSGETATALPVDGIDPRYEGSVILSGSTDSESLDTLSDYFATVFETSEREYRGDGFWGRGQGQERVEFLQYNCHLLIGLQAAIRAGLDPSGEYAKRVQEGTAYLRAVQTDSGMMPHPNETILARGSHQGVISQGLREGLLTADGVWIVKARGHLAASASIAQGNCAVALIGAYLLFGDDQDLEAASRIADWVEREQKPSGNTNLNSFGVGALVAVYGVTQQESLLAYAVELTRDHILPRQLDSGRWEDPHNGLLNYHLIILRYMVELYRALPADHEFASSLKGSIQKAVAYATEHIAGRRLYTKPSQFLADCIVALSLYDEVFGADQKTLEALHLLVKHRPDAATLEAAAPGTLRAYSETAYGMGSYIEQRSMK